MAQLNLPTKQKQTHRHTGTDCGWQGAEGRGEGQDWGFGISRSKLVCIRWINKKALLYSTGNYIQCSIINQNGKEYKKVYMWVSESLLYSRN